MSEKIKSNTLKISSANEPEVGQTEDKLSQTTASRSDLSIDEGDLNCFKEYLMHENIKKGGADQEIEEPKDEQPRAGKRAENFLAFAPLPLEEKYSQQVNSSITDKRHLENSGSMYIKLKQQTARM